MLISVSELVPKEKDFVNIRETFVYSFKFSTQRAE
jgi:hypothetical protein